MKIGTACKLAVMSHRCDGGVLKSWWGGLPSSSDLWGEALRWKSYKTFSEASKVRWGGGDESSQGFSPKCAAISFLRLDRGVYLCYPIVLGRPSSPGGLPTSSDFWGEAVEMKWIQNVLRGFQSSSGYKTSSMASNIFYWPDIGVYAYNGEG